MTKKKMNITKNADADNNNSVQGVEKNNRQRWIKFVGMAAVGIIAGGIGGGNYLFNKMKDSASTVSSSSETGAATESSVITSITTTATTTAVAETTAAITKTKSLTLEEAVAHKLTDNYWNYECFFYTNAHSIHDGAKYINCKYTYQSDGETIDTEILYCKTADERLTENTMDGLKKLYNAYYSKNYDPFYSANVETKNRFELFGPSFTADTLPTDRKIDREYTFIEYDGELYQKIIPSQYLADEHWADDQIDITDVTVKSFTLKRKIHVPPKDGELPGEFTFKIVFDEEIQDWRIEQKVEEYEYPNTSVAAEN